MSNPVLVVEDDATLRSNIAELLTEEGFSVIVADNGADGIALAQARKPALIICDIMLPGVDGYGVLQAIREDPRVDACPFIFLTARSERADVRTGMDLGADDYLTKPFALSELKRAVLVRLARAESIRARAHQAVERESAHRSNPLLAFAAGEGVVVSDPKMQALYEQGKLVANSSISVLILGETGVGKEIFARAIHNLSPRRHGPFLALNCGALTESLLEAELFGHEKGAFTGAFQARMGLFESAGSGTLFLDEIGELPPATQSRLLRVLEERKVTRVGGRTAKEIDVRFISATNRDIDAETASGRFRRDLYYRVCGMACTVPPLRERRGEIRDLSRMFAARACAEQGRDPIQLASETLHLLEAHDWPGNVRELRNAIERAVVMCRGSTLRPEHLPAWPRSAPQHPPPSGASSNAAPPSAPRSSEAPPTPAPSTPAALYSQYRDATQEEERRSIEAALIATGGNQTAAAERLGISRRKLVYRLKELGIPGPRKRAP